MAPERFFVGRTFVSMYNLVLLIAIWHKLRQARREKMDLEYMFFKRTESIMATMNSVLSDDTTAVAVSTK
jgi:hypothetical protein